MNIIRIEGDIGVFVTAASVREQLLAVAPGARPLVQINSEGGSVSEAVAIFQELLAWPGGVDTAVVGWALSAASVIFLAGRTRRVYPTSLVMVHAPWLGNTSGNAEQLREKAEMLDQVTQAMRAAYRRTGRTDAQIAVWLDGQDHWFTADEALRVGLATEVASDAASAAARIPREVYAACRFPLPQHLIERIKSMSTEPQPHGVPNAAAAAIAAAVQAENRRQAEIRAAFARHQDVPADLLERCLANPATDVAQAKLQLLNHLGASSFSVAGHYAPAEPGGAGGDRARIGEFMAGATDAMLIRGGLRVQEPHPAVRDVQSLSVVAMAERVLSMHGKSTARKSPVEIISAALSTSDFPALLANVGAKALRTGYTMAQATFRGWTGEREVPDFKPQSLVMLSEAPALLKVMEGAEYKFGKFDDSGSVFQVETFGRLVSLTRQALINDELGAFAGMLGALGQAAVRLEADSVYAKLTSNPVLGDTLALFDAAHGNVTAAAAPSVTSLGLARAAMRKQRGIQGLDFIDPQPRYLIAPVSLETTCEQLLSSLVDPSKNNDTGNLDWIRGLELVADPRLDAVSESVWYLAAAPQQVEGIVRAYLIGAERPYLEQKDEFTRDVTDMKARHDLAVGVVDYRALHRVG